MSSGFRIGVRPIPGDATDPALLARIVELAREAEAAGIALLAVPERLGPGGVPAALQVCAAAAAATRELIVATAVLPLALHHPLRVAEDVATLDGLSNGRFELGVGIGEDRGALAGFGLDAEERGDRFEEAIAILRAALREGPVEYAGRHFRVDGIEVFPKPARAGGPPLWVGAGAESALRRAARLDLGVLVRVGTAVDAYLEECAASGSSPRIAVTGPAEATIAEGRTITVKWPVPVDLWIEVDPANTAALDEVVALVRPLVA